jgi:phosphoserine phosphatase
MVHGMGNDSVGLVGSITTPIAKAGGNIVDLRQDVLHGLFVIIMVVDLSETELHLEEFRKMVRTIAEDTNLEMTVEKYSPVARPPEKMNLLLILVGKDAPGIIAAITESLSKYRINIEFAKTIAREGIFLMELLTDISKCAIPFQNLRSVLSENMASMDIKTIFQAEDVFNKKKRVILFDIASTFIDRARLDEILRLTAIDWRELTSVYSLERPLASLQRAASYLAGMPVDLIARIVERVEATPDTTELVQTLKIMGYKVALMSNAFSFLTDSLKGQLDIDYCSGVNARVDDDTRTIVGELDPDADRDRDRERVIANLAEKESIDRESITVVTDEGFSETPGIGLSFDMAVLLDAYNDHVINKENLVGVLGSFGIPGKG